VEAHVEESVYFWSTCSAVFYSSEITRTAGYRVSTD